MALSTQIATAQQGSNKFLIAPSNITEAMTYAKMISDSNFCPKDLKGKAGDVLIAMQMGAEIGLSPMQALQNIAVINSRPTIWGDAALAVVVSHPAYVSHREWTEGSTTEGNLTAYCGVTRKNSDEHIKSFSMEDAKKAGLWSKAGVWQQYPSRMLQMRARAFAIRDKFADALRGINVREEVEDYVVRESKIFPIRKPEVKNELAQTVQVTVVEDKVDESDLDQMLLDISQARDIKELEDVYRINYKTCAAKKDKDSLARIMDAKDIKKNELTLKEFNSEYGEVEK